MAWGSFGLVSSGNLTLTEVAPFVNQICDLLNLSLFQLDSNTFNTSYPKVMDNKIMAFVKDSPKPF